MTTMTNCYSESLPSGWEMITVADAVEIIPISGKKIQRSEYKNVGKIPIIDQGQNFIGGYTDDIDTTIEDVNLPVIIFGDHTKIIKYVDFPFAPGADGIKVLKPRYFFIPKLFYYFSSFIKIPNRGYSRHFQYYAKSLIPLPPLAEQRRIIKKLETLGTFLEFVKYTIQRAIQNLADYRQRLLSDAFNGKITEAWRNNNESFTKLNSKLEIITSKDDEAEKALFLDDYPTEWTLERLDKVAIKIQDGTHFSPKNQYQEPGENRFLYISAKNIKDNGVDLDNVSYIDRDVHESIYKRCNVEKGDVLLIKDGATTGIATKNNLDVQFSLLSSVAFIKPNILFLDSDYLVYFLRSPIGQQQIMEKMTGTAIKRIILDKIRSMIIPIPSIEEQKIISSKLAQIDREYETIINNLMVINTKRNLLIRSILNQAFTGKLVPQDSNDEPASVLLERITNEEAKTEVGKKRAKHNKYNQEM